ncbi:ParB/Sulfiredoxin [Blastocladiella britannica]|nr:ParB/Sulfiredoxin [Blastocladiella britannica]
MDPSLSISAFTQSEEVVEVPIAVIARPIPSVLNPAKVHAFTKLIQNGTDMTPIEVMHLERVHPRTGAELHYYFAVGGCHRWAAHKELGRDTIRARIIDVSEETLRTYFGNSLKLKLE